MGKTASQKQCQGVNAKHSVTLLRACHSANQHCSITSCTLLSRLQKSFYFKCMFKSFPRRALGGWSGEGKAGEESRGWIVEERYKCYVFLLPFYSMAGSLHHSASCHTCGTGSAECPITEGPLAQSMCRGPCACRRAERDTDEPSKTIPLSWHCDIQPSEYTIYREICKYAIFSQPPSWKHAHTRSPSRLIVPFKRQNENSISLCRQKMEREERREREIEGSLRNMRQGYFPITQPFSAIPEGKLWSAREAKRKSHSFISIRGLFCFSSQACGPYTCTHAHTEKNLEKCRVAKGNGKTLGEIRKTTEVHPKSIWTLKLHSKYMKFFRQWNQIKTLLFWRKISKLITNVQYTIYNFLLLLYVLEEK